VRNTEYVYLAGPIAGLTYEDANKWREEFQQDLPEFIHCLSPTRFKNFAAGRIGTQPYNIHPLSTDKGLTRRDLFDVERSSAIIVNFLDTERVSIGTCIEIGAKGVLDGRLMIMIMEKDNCHDHPMIREIADYVVTSVKEAKELLVAIL
jgi:hypothetical protein